MYDELGYVILPELFKPDAEWLTEEVINVVKAHGGECKGGYKNIHPLLDYSEKLSALLDDNRIDGIASQILGSDYNYGLSDGQIDREGSGVWHPDSDYSWTAPHISGKSKLSVMKFIFYLTPTTKETGAMRILPGSHLPGSTWRVGPIPGWKMANESMERWGIPSDQIPGQVVFESQPGDVLIFNQDVIHAAFPGGKRVQFAIDFLRAFKPTERDLFDYYLKRMARYSKQSGEFIQKQMYGETMLATASESRMRHLSQLAERHPFVYLNKQEAPKKEPPTPAKVSGVRFFRRS